MAAGLDGNVDIGLDLDTKPATKALNNFRNKMRGTFGGQDAKALDQNIKQTERTIKSLEKEIDKTKSKLQELSSGETTPKSVIALEKELKAAEQEAIEVGKKLEQAAEKARIASTPQTVTAATGKIALPIDADALSKANAELKSAEEAALSATARVEQLRAKLYEVKGNPQATDEAKKLNNELGRATRELSRQKKKYQELKDEQSTFVESGKKGTSVLEKSFKRLGTMIKRVFVFSVILKGLRKIKSAISGIIANNKEMSSTLAQIQGNLWTAFAPLWEAILPGFQSVLSVIKSITGYIAGFISGIFGKTIKESQKAGKALATVAGGYKDAGDEAKKSLASFDTINIVESSKSGGADNGGTSGTTTPDFSETTAAMENGLALGERIRKILQPLIDLFGLLSDKLGPLPAILLMVVGGFLLFKAIKWVLGWLLGFGKSSKTVAAGFSSLLKSFGEATVAIAILGGLALVIKSLADLITAYSESGLTLGEFAAVIGIAAGVIAAAFVVLLGAMTMMKPGWEDMVFAAVVLGGLALVMYTMTCLFTAFAESGMTMGETIVVLVGILVIIIGTITALTIAAQALATNPLAMVALVLLAGSLCAVFAVLASTIDIVLDALGRFIEKTAPSFIAITDVILEGIQNIITALGTVLPPIIAEIGTLFEKVFAGISTVINSVGSVITGILNSTKDLITTVLDKILYFIKSAGPAINDFVDNIIKAVTKLINFIIQGVEFMINTTIIKAINALLKGINKIPGIDIPTIDNVKLDKFVPKLAQGTVVPPNREFLAVLGDNKREHEIVSPLSTMKQAFIEAMREMGGTTSNGKTEVVLEVDGREFGRAVVEQGNRENRRIGTRLVIA